MKKIDVEKDIKNKLMVVPEDAYKAMHYFKNNKLEAFGIIRNQWKEDKSHSFRTKLELPEFAEIFSPLKSDNIKDFIHNFLRMHHDTHDNKMVKVTIEILEVKDE